MKSWTPYKLYTVLDDLILEAIPLSHRIELSHGSVEALEERVEKAKLMKQLNRLDHICSYTVDGEGVGEATDQTSGNVFHMTVAEAREHSEFLAWLRDEEIT